ncbi:MAG: hypothetical protein PHZ28_03785 [Candidatus Izemoplasmatales bacterium]|nr:hypothetical protein [Candidatus Izemoplasmatales bacterium]
MKATTYEPGQELGKMSQCDKKPAVTCVTPKPKRESQQLKLLTRTILRHVTPSDGVTKRKVLGVTRKPDRFVTATVIQSGIYIARLRMSKETIKAIWLTIERVAELKGCSNRTVWRYITGQRMLTHKQLVKSGQRNICKTFVLTNPEIYDLEIHDCETHGVTPSEYLEAQIEVDGRIITGALVYGYAPVESGLSGGSDELL